MVSIKKLRNGGGAFFVFAIVLGIWFPMAIKSRIKNEFRLKPGAEIRGIWEQFPFPFDFKIFIFNVTNSDEIAKGKKPILNEVGPFFYDEYKIKVDLIDREDDDTVEYSMKTIWEFNPKKSKYTGEEELVIPHFMILGIVLSTLTEHPDAIEFVVQAVDSIFHKPDSIFIRTKAKDLLFDGLPINCNVTDFPGSTVCNMLAGNANFVPDGENHYKLSFFGAKNDTVLPERMRVLRGIKNYKDIGRVVEFDGETSLDVWPDDHCNAFNGTDATIFPPLIKQEDDLVAFGFEACRNFRGHFVRHTKNRGINTLRYIIDLGDQSKNQDEKCFCSTPDTCLTKNLFDLTKCLGVPIILSLPHFYDSEEKYQYMVDGLHPNKDKHENYFDIEPTTAAALVAYKRMQCNLYIKPIAEFPLMQNFPEALLPLFWIEEGLILPDEFVKKVKLISMMLTIVNYLKWLMILGGIGLVVASAVLQYHLNRDADKRNITKIIPKNDIKVYTMTKDTSWPYNININRIQAAMVPSNLDKD